MTTTEYWEHYLASTNQKPEDAVFSGEFAFENTGAVGTEQLALLLTGKKTATFSAFESYGINREPLPVAGEVYIVKNSADEPCCIIEVTDVQVLPFKSVSWEMAQKEGEDENLASWQEKTREYMEDEAAICGFDFTEDSRIVFEAYRIIFR